MGQNSQVRYNTNDFNNSQGHIFLRSRVSASEEAKQKFSLERLSLKFKAFP